MLYRLHSYAAVVLELGYKSDRETGISIYNIVVPYTKWKANFAAYS